MAEAPSQLSIPIQALDCVPPERIFDLTWATTVVEHAFQRLREECESKGKLWLFQALSSHPLPSATKEHAKCEKCGATMRLDTGVCVSCLLCEGLEGGDQLSQAVY